MGDTHSGGIIIQYLYPLPEYSLTDNGHVPETCWNRNQVTHDSRNQARPTPLGTANVLSGCVHSSFFWQYTHYVGNWWKIGIPEICPGPPFGSLAINIGSTVIRPTDITLFWWLVSIVLCLGIFWLEGRWAPHPSWSGSGRELAPGDRALSPLQESHTTTLLFSQVDQTVIGCLHCRPHVPACLTSVSSI